MAGQVRPNTVVLDFKWSPFRPSVREIEQLTKKMSIRHDDLITVQMHHVRNSVLITFKQSDAATRFCNEHHLKHTVHHEKMEFRVPVYIDDNAIEVRVHDLPITLDDNVIIRQMSAFGEVLSIRHDKWQNFFPGLFNGVRILRMRVIRSIPSYVKFETTTYAEKSRVSFYGQKATCQWCSQAVHFGKPCEEAAIQETTSIENNNTPYNRNTKKKASVRNESQPTSSKPQVTKNAETTEKTTTVSSNIPTSSLPTKITTVSNNNEFTVVTRRNKNTEHTTQGQNETSDDAEEEISDLDCEMDPQPEGSGSPENASSPPRKKITARARNNEHRR